MSRASALEAGLNASAGRGRRTARKDFTIIDGGDEAALSAPSTDEDTSDTAVAAAVDVLTEPASVDTPTGTPEVVPASSEPANTPKETTAADTAALSPEATLDLARHLTHRQRHGDKKPTRVTIACPRPLFLRIEAVTRKMGTDPRIGPGLTPLNKGALMTEAARRFGHNPTAYPAVLDDQFTANPPLHGGVADDIWNDMKTTWWDMDTRSPNFGQHVAAALDEIVTELESLYPTN